MNFRFRISAALARWRERRAEKKRRRELRKAANKFNWQAVKESLVFGPLKWMCPDCGKVSVGKKFSIFSGWQYEPCCTAFYSSFYGWRSHHA